MDTMRVIVLMLLYDGDVIQAPGSFTTYKACHDRGIEWFDAMIKENKENLLFNCRPVLRTEVIQPRKVQW